jgi:release factor glutamine methyltransferase
LRCRVRRLDFLRDDPRVLGEFSALLMNPPYITEEEMKTLPDNVKREPALALLGGEDGLDFYRRAASLEALYAKTLIFEIGHSQGEALKELFSGGEVLRDVSGNDRVFLVNYKK